MRGFTLVEVLVSVLILSFGALGVVGLQAAALRSHREAKNQMLGVQLARELADMVRGNPAVGAKIDHNPYLGSFVPNAAGEMAPASAAYCLAVGSACDSATAVAQAQLTQWLAHVGAVLPTARVVICFDSEPFDARGLPRWACSVAPGPSTPLVIKIGWTRTSLDRSGALSTGLDLAKDPDSVPSVLLPCTP